MSAEAWSPLFKGCHENSSCFDNRFALNPLQMATLASVNTTLPWSPSFPVLPDYRNVIHHEFFKYLMFRQSLLQGSVPTPQQLFNIIQQLFKASHQASSTSLLQPPTGMPTASSSSSNKVTASQVRNYELMAEDLSTQRNQEFWEQHSDLMNVSTQDTLTKLGVTTATLPSPSTDSSPSDPNLSVLLLNPGDLNHVVNPQNWAIPDVTPSHSVNRISFDEDEFKAPARTEDHTKRANIERGVYTRSYSPPTSLCDLVDLRITTVPKPGDQSGSSKIKYSTFPENLVRSGGNNVEQYFIQYLQQQKLNHQAYNGQREHQQPQRGYCCGGYPSWLEGMSRNRHNKLTSTISVTGQHNNVTIFEQTGSPLVKSLIPSDSSQQLEPIMHAQHSFLNRLTPGSLGVLYSSDSSCQSDPVSSREIKSPNPIDGAFSCRLCHKSYSQPSALKMHVRTHTLPCRCSHCGKSFSRKWLLKGHERTHTGERPYACPICSRSFADRSNLRAHLQTHQRDKRYACRCCPRSFSRMGLLNKHKSQCLATQAAAVAASTGNFDHKPTPPLI